jgi:hypothetical protein
MEKKERRQLFKTSIEKIVEEAKESGIVIFEAGSDKFVQFCYDPEESSPVCDIPITELSAQEEEKLLLLKEFPKGSGAFDDKNQLVAYHTYLKGEDLNKATNLTERILVCHMQTAKTKWLYMGKENE